MRKSRKKERKPIPVPLTSMGDIAFLLIIFFMLASDFIKEPNLKVEPPRSEHVKKTEVAVVTRVAMDAELTVGMP